MFHMKTVFILQHVSKEMANENVKLIGVYSSLQEAEAAIERLKSKPGFLNATTDFHIDKYEINKDHWAEGFVS